MINAPTVGQRANAMLAEYMALEAEQHRLGDIDANDPQISALGEKAIAIADELPKLFDSAGSADHAAACVLVEMMLQRHDWSRLDEIEFGEGDTEGLAVLSALAGATTGTVREATRRVLLKIGRDIWSAEPNPLAELVAAFREVEAADALLSDEEADKAWAARGGYGPAFERLRDDPPAATSTAGVMAALQLMADEVAKGNDWLNEGFLGRAVLPFFEGRA